jgi:hypothetical protein
MRNFFGFPQPDRGMDATIVYVIAQFLGHIGVDKPGATVLMVMLREPASLAVDLANPIIPPLQRRN